MYLNTSQVRMRGYSSNHYHGGKVVCEEMFMFLHGVGRTRMKNLKKSLEERGIGPQIHGYTATLNDVHIMLCLMKQLST